MKVLTIVLVTLFFLTISISISTDWFQRGYQVINEIYQPKSKQMVTYYQWTDSQGRTIISRDAPPNELNFITFEASDDLQNSSNKVDRKLIERSEKYRAELAAKSDSNSLAAEAQTATTNASLFDALQKARHCAELSSQLTDMRLKGVDSESAARQSEALAAQVIKECTNVVPQQ